MDYEEMSKAIKKANSKYEPYKPVEHEKTIWKAPKVADMQPHLPPPMNPTAKNVFAEVDYGIVKMGDNSYVVVRSHYLGSLDYDVVCNCESRHEAREIVRALNK